MKELLAPPQKKLKRGKQIAYFETAKTVTPLGRAILLVDKNPLAMNSVPMIHRLFPDGRIILAVRHPCDVVLSCFVTNFKAEQRRWLVFSARDRCGAVRPELQLLRARSELLTPTVHKVVYENIVSRSEAANCDRCRVPRTLWAHVNPRPPGGRAQRPRSLSKPQATRRW